MLLYYYKCYNFPLWALLININFNNNINKANLKLVSNVRPGLKWGIYALLEMEWPMGMGCNRLHRFQGLQRTDYIIIYHGR